MSRSTKSRSRSRSRSRTRSHSSSRSRSCSRSRSRKHRYSSRSRSRSRSRSPSYNRDKKYSRGYQNNRELRGYHRGFRRPYNFRGRGRGYFPRGRYQRGGGGGGCYNNNNFRPNWKNNNKQHPQKQQQYQNNPRGRGRGRPNDPQKRFRSPPQSQSRHSDRSASPSSRLSQHSSSSSSHSSSPKCLTALLLGNQGSKDVKENSVSKEVQKEGGEGGGDGGPVELGVVLAEVAKDGGSGSGKTEGSGLGLTDCSSSPKRTGPMANSALMTGRPSQTINQSGPTPKNTNDTNNSAPQWSVVSNSAAAKHPSREGLNPMLSSFDFYSTEEYLEGDKTAISIAFRQFLEEQNKKAASALENGKSAEANGTDMDRGKVNGKASAGNTDSISRKYKGDTDGEVSLNSLLKTSPFLSTNGEEEEEMTIKPHSKSLHRDWHNGDESSKLNSKVSHSAQGLFEERLGKWKNVTYSQVADTDLDGVAEELYLSRKQDKAFAVALGRRESTGLEELSPDRNCKARKTAKSPSVSPPALPLRRNSDREMFMLRGGDSPVVSSRKQDAKFNVRMDFLGDSLLSSSDILAQERQLSQDLVQSSKKDQEFRSIFQHVQTAQLHKTPSELFAQHIVTIVHQTKAQYFPPSGMTLNERFTMYQRRAAEKEMMKPRKSPEIHRRLDVSTSAFKKHSQLFEAVKNPEDGTYKDGGDKIKGDPMDLRLDIERRKKYSTHERNFNQDRGRDLGDSPNSSQERSVEKFTQCHKRSEKSKKRSRSSSSSSSSSRASQQEDLPLVRPDPKEEAFNKARLGQGESPASERGRPHGFQVRICGRICNNSNCQGDSASSNTINMAAQQKMEGLEPEFTPKNRQYYLHDDRDEESNCKWTINRGRERGSFLRGGARFIIRKATGGTNAKNPNWAHNKFQVKGEQGSREEEMEQDHNEGGIDGENH